MKLDVNALRYLSKDDFRALTAVELGMRNHEIVPTELIHRIAALKHGGTYKVLKNLLKHKLVHHDSSRYDGFRLTYLGYDFLAIKAMVNGGVFSSVGRQIGVGKESDIFEVASEDGTIMAMKLHRLGRVSFRAVKSKRDYLKHRRSYNWLYLSRLAALKEFAFMEALEQHGFPVPHAVRCNRHCVVMSLVQGYPLVQVKQLQNPDVVFETIISLIVRFAEHGLIHCDFNEFNIMIDDEEKLTVIDFPQMVSVSHRNAQMYFDRDVECIFKFFKKRFNLTFEEELEESDSIVDKTDTNYSRVSLSSISIGSGLLDEVVAASGFKKQHQEEMERFIEGESDDESEFAEEEGTSDDSDSDEEPMQNGSENIDISALSLSDQAEKSSVQKDEVSSSDQPTAPETNDASDDEDGVEGSDEEDPELKKSLSKQRRRAIASAHGKRRPITSRNSYKDKGGKSSQSSKVQKQMDIW